MVSANTTGNVTADTLVEGAVTDMIVFRIYGDRISHRFGQPLHGERT